MNKLQFSFNELNYIVDNLMIFFILLLEKEKI